MDSLDPAGAALEDLEQQAAGLFLSEREEVVADLADASYAQVGLHARMHASVGRELRLRLAGGWQVAGLLDRVGADFAVLVHGPAQWTVRIATLRSVDGLGERARSAQVLPATAKLALTSVLRRLVGTGCVLHDIDGAARACRPVRIGADFAEVIGPDAGAGSSCVVPLTALAAIRSTR